MCTCVGLCDDVVCCCVCMVIFVLCLYGVYMRYAMLFFFFVVVSCGDVACNTYINCAAIVCVSYMYV